MVRIGEVYPVSVFIEQLESEEVHALLDEVHIAEVLEVQNELGDGSQ